ncbi:NERD domain-containing protein [Streptomyces sp. A3M-1-3]|uniref:nuclease-related domain-containing protein n=1 Tax=Streptomyces sp. A3M-1-3 TaxID=2962044 RepID=UPI0020B7A4E3|nr:nuclease-related domain-containing protein [Streptomyces sp. A3M-1-3]MCP3821717.1 NERD domain-containing protein [Streptomyces sp. A3M-1-3]
MRGLRVTPARRYGQDRLYVSLPDGLTVAWYDRETARVSVLSADHRDAALAALAPYLSGPCTVGPPPVPTAADLARLALHPDDDLAPNRPGEGLYGEALWGGALYGGALYGGALYGGAWGRRSESGRRRALAAQQLIGDELDRLEGAGWRVLHSVPLPGGGRIDHLLIGPAGAMTVRTVDARKRRALVGEQAVAIGRAEPLPQTRWARREAARAAHALVASVRPVLAVVAAARLEVVPSLHDVRVLRDVEVRTLGTLGGELKPADVESLYATARDRRTWLRA